MRPLVLSFAAAMQSARALRVAERPSFDPSVFHRLRFGHRGGSAEGPENTIALLMHNVVNHGMLAAEIDLQLTLDGHLVMFHDETISRMLDTPADTLVSEMTLAELRAIPYRDRRLGEVHVSTLEELLSWFQQMHLVAGLPIMLELDFKPNSAQAPLAVNRLMAAIAPVNKSMQGALEKSLFVSSFYPEVLKEIRRYSKTLALGFAFNAHSEEHPILGRLAAYLARFVARKFNCQIIEPNVEWLSDRWIARWKRRGYLISSYPADTVKERAYLDSFGIAYTTSLVSIHKPAPKPDQNIHPKPK